MNTTTLNMTTLDGGNVIIKKGGGGGSTPTPPSGGESGGIEYEYFALTDGWVEDLRPEFVLVSSFVKVETSTFGIVILPVAYAELLSGGGDINPPAIAIDMSLITSMGGQQMTIKDMILASGVTEESLAKYRITKEQFYNLD